MLLLYIYIQWQLWKDLSFANEFEVPQIQTFEHYKQRYIIIIMVIIVKQINGNCSPGSDYRERTILI